MLGCRPLGIKLLSSLVVILLIMCVFAGNAHALFWDKQEFDNLEKRSITGHPATIVNKYFSIVKDFTINDVNLMKAAIFFALFLAIVQFGFMQGGVAEFGKYLFVAILLLLPFIQGKPLPIFIADTSDRITEKIIGKIGAPQPQTAGSTVFAVQSYNNAKTEIISNNKRNLINFNKYCYNKAVQEYQKANQTTEVPKPSDQKLKTYYQNLMVDFGNIPHKLQAESLLLTGSVSYTCSEVKTTIESDLQSDFKDYMSKAANSITNTNGSIPEDIQKQINNMGNITSGELLDWGSGEVAGLENQGEKRNRGLSEWGLSAIMVVAKGLIFGVGMIFMWIFDYYIFDIVAAVKTVAAMGLAFGVLYYMYFKDIKIPLTSLGLWVASNGLYIIAGINMMIFRETVEGDAGGLVGGALSGLGWLLGFDTIFGRAITTLAFSGTASTIMAGTLSWAGFKGTLATFAAAKLIPKSSGKKGPDSSPGGSAPTPSTPPPPPSAPPA